MDLPSRAQPLPSADVIFYGEVGCYRRVPHIKQGLLLDDEYDRDNPDGSEYTRRNYDETCYVSGVPDLEPGEYPWLVGTRYSEYRFSDRK